MSSTNDVKTTNELYKSLGFQTERSRCIPLNKLALFQKKIDRKASISKLQEVTKNIVYATEIEAGIYEFCLIYMIENKLHDSSFKSVYEYIVFNIVKNIIKNHEIIDKIKIGALKPHMIAFMKPHQLNPENWSALLTRIQKQEEAENNLPTTDAFKCRRCEQRRCTVRYLQTRSSDEPMTIFVTCCNCHNTFTI